MPTKRRFGRVRKLPSGRWQARYPGPDGVDRPAPETFPTKRAAEIWLSEKELEIRQGDWLDPDAGQTKLADFAATWLREHPGLRPKTRQLYEGLLRLHILPTLGHLAVVDVKEARVRTWHHSLLSSRLGPTTVSKSYRLLRTILGTAVDDGLIKRNPCRIKGAATEKAPERPTLTLPQVAAMADAVGPRYRLLVLLAVFAGLRWGELTGLTRANVDVDARLIRVRETVVEMKDGSRVFGPPKSAAGVRNVAIPEFIVGEVRWHLERFAEPGPAGHLFIGERGALLRRTTFTKHWERARTEVGLPGIHFHDLRHTGNTLAAATGASLAELMARMGHSSTRAAIIYQHATSDRDKVIADALGELAQAAWKPARAVSDEGSEEATGT